MALIYKFQLAFAIKNERISLLNPIPLPNFDDDPDGRREKYYTALAEQVTHNSRELVRQTVIGLMDVSDGSVFVRTKVSDKKDGREIDMKLVDLRKAEVAEDDEAE